MFAWKQQEVISQGLHGIDWPFTPPTFWSAHNKFHELCEADSGDLCKADDDLCKADGDLGKADGGDLTTACSQMPQLPLSYSIASCTAKTFLSYGFLNKGEKLKLFPVTCCVTWTIAKLLHKDDKFLKFCTIVTWRAWFYVLPARVPKAFLFWILYHINSTSSWHNSPGKAVHFGIKRIQWPIPRSQMLQTQTHTHAQNTCT